MASKNLKKSCINYIYRDFLFSQYYFQTESGIFSKNRQSGIKISHFIMLKAQKIFLTLPIGKNLGQLYHEVK